MQNCEIPLEIIQGVPGFKPILKAIIRAQVVALVKQLAEQTGEQTIVLSADISDQTFCQFGSDHGGEFLTKREDVKRDFLQHCLNKCNDPLSTCQKNNRISTVSSSLSASLRQADTVADTKPMPNTRQKLAHSKGVKSVTRKEDNAHLNSSELSGIQTRRRKKEKKNVIDVGKEVEDIDKDQLEECPEIKKTRKDEGNSSSSSESVEKCTSGTKNAEGDISIHDCTSEVSDTSNSFEDSNKVEEEVEMATEVDGSERNKKFGSKDQRCVDQREYGAVDDRAFGPTDLGETGDIPQLVDDINSESGMTGENHFNKEREYRQRLDEPTSNSETTDSQSTNKNNKQGRSTVSGQALDEDLRTSIVMEVIRCGGDVKTGRVPRGVFTNVGRTLAVSLTSVTRIWERYVNDGTLKPRPKPSGKS